MVEIQIQKIKQDLDKLNRLKLGNYKVKWKSDKLHNLKVNLDTFFKKITYSFINEGKDSYTLYLNNLDKDAVLLSKSMEKILRCKVKIVLGNNKTVVFDESNIPPPIFNAIFSSGLVVVITFCVVVFCGWG